MAGGKTRGQIGFYTGMHPDRVSTALRSLVKQRLIKRFSGPVHWIVGGKNGNIYPQEDMRIVYRKA